VRRLAALVCALVALTACGVDTQAAPEDVDVAPVPSSPATPSETGAGPQVVLWFLRDGRLEPVRREAPGSGPATALTLLSEGPTAEEVTEGLTTALTPQPLAVVDGRQTDTTVTVAVSPAFTSVSGENQLRAVAQVVWTATEFAGVEQVRFTTEDGALEVPTDDGLTDEPVDRDDYASVAPEGRTPALSRGTPAMTTPPR
jgi:spore germination protein GerM